MGKVLHASGSGYFPTCIQEASSPDHCPWTLEKAMQTYWRVRTWTFSVSGLRGESGDPGPIYPFSDTISNLSSGDFEGNEYYTSEEQLVCSNSFFFNSTQGEVGAFIAFGNPEKSGDLYTSGIYGYLQNFSDESLVCEFRVYPEYPVEPGDSENGTVTILGATLPLNIYLYDPEVSISFADVVATLTPTLWWSYGGTYDTATGNPL